MAIAIGNKTTSNLNPNGGIQTLAHIQNTGSDRFLLVVVTMSNSTSFSSCTYDNVAMTLVNNQNFSGLGQRQAFFVLANPNTGNNNIQVVFSGNQWTSTSIIAQSFTGADGYESFGTNGASASPHTRSISISANSIIYGTGISVNSQSFNYEIAGGARTPAFNGHVTPRIVEGAFGPTGLSAGSYDVATKVDFSTVSNARIAIKEKAGTPPSSRRRIIIT